MAGPEPVVQERSTVSISLPAIADLNPQQRKVYDIFPANLSLGLVMTAVSAKPYLALGLSFRQGGLPAQTRELVILRVGAATNAAYEIHHHKREAQLAGVPDPVIDAVLSGATVFADRGTEILMTFVDDLLSGISGPAPDAGAIQEIYSDNEIAEIVLLAGHYVMTAMFIKTLGIVPETDTDASDLLATATAKLGAPEPEADQ